MSERLETTSLYLPARLVDEANTAAKSRGISRSAYISLAIETHVQLDDTDLSPDNNTMFDVSTGRTIPFIDYHDSAIELLDKTNLSLMHVKASRYGKAALSGLAEAEQVTTSLFVARGLAALNFISQNAVYFPVMVRSPETNDHVLVG